MSGPAASGPAYAEPRAVGDIADCHVYHSMDIAGAGEVTGDWDLRGGEDAYLGRVDLAGARVLEIGPASGFLTFHMESRGAEVVAVELAPDADWDVVPQAGLDLDTIVRDRRAIMERLRNGFWFAHERLGSRARVHHGTAYDLPAALGRFDVAVMAAVLLHLRDPLRAVQACAGRADCLVIADLHDPALDGVPRLRLEPTPANGVWDTWWWVSPAAVVQFCGVLGFTDVTVTHHDQRFIGGPVPVRLPMFTVVARRPAA